MKKDLNYYLQNPDEMPDDPKEIEALANEHMSKSLEVSQGELTIEEPSEDAEEKPVIKDETANADGDTSSTEVKEEKEVEKQEPKDEKPEGILARDGKNLIPYSQLESARQRAADAERLLVEQKEEIERLKAANQPTKTPDSEMLTEEELNALQEDSPTLAKVLRAQQSVIKQLNDTVEDLSARSQRDQESKKEDDLREVQEAIDATPELAAWQTNEDQTMWDRAAAFDKTLRELPEFANITFEDRFKRVVALTKSAFPPDFQEEPIIEQPKVQDVKAVAKEKLASASKKAIPMSLSDIPGGAPPAVDEKQKLEQMSSVELGSQFLGMSKDQLDAYLSNL